jgi:hypothetical protein
VIAMRAWILGCLIALLVAGVAVAVALDEDESSWTFTSGATDPTLPPTVAAPPSDPAPGMVIREALHVARRDEMFRRLAADGRPRLVGSSVWADIEGAPVGARLVFRLRRAIAVDADLPVADVPPDAPTEGDCEAPYRQTWLHEQAHGVTQLSVWVDLRQHRVAEISTNAKSGRRSWVDGRPHPSCRAVESG